MLITLLSACQQPPHAAASAPFDLTTETMFVRSGFSEKWTNRLPAKDDRAWIVVPPGKDGQRSLQVVNLDLPEVPARMPLSIHQYPPQTFTFVTRFNVNAASMEKGRINGLFLAHIAVNWEIYVNGNLVRQEMHVRQDGGISRHKSSRHVLVPLDPRQIHAGENILAFRIYGDPTFTDTGFLHQSPYLVGDFRELEDKRSESIPLVLTFLYGFVGLYYLFLFSNRRKEIYNLFYGLFCIALFVYLFMRTHTIELVIPDSYSILRLELASLYTLVPLLGLFIESIIEKKISLFTVIYGCICGSFVLLTIMPLPESFYVDVLRIWQLSSIIPVLYYSVYRLGFRFYRILRTRHARARQTGQRFPRVQALRLTLMRSIAGNLIVGVVVLASTTIFDVVDAALLQFDLILTRYGFLAFVLGTALIISNKFISLQVKNEKLNVSLRQKISDLDEANRNISISEEKYRLLVEGTNECIFTLDDEFRFRNANRAMIKFMHASPLEIREITIFDILHEDLQEKGVARTLLMEKLDTLKSERVPVAAKVVLKPLGPSEPQEFMLRLEGITIEGKNEILGRASHVLEDTLLNYFVYERQKYEIANFLITAEEISHRLVRNLAKYLGTQEINYVRIGLREMIINAIEHGNLDIGFEEKSQATMDDNYIEFVMKRQGEPRFRDRRVRIEYLLSSERVAYKIADDGNGFDYRAMLEKVKNRVNEEMLYHGRGITMAMNIFDKITYNRKGNEVLLEKFLSPKKILEPA